MAFVVEEIPDEDRLFRKIRALHVPKPGVISSAAFDEKDMSVNWEKYSSAEETADSNCPFVVALGAGFCRGLGQTVVHTPIQEGERFGPNQAHTEVCGKKTNSVKHRMRDNATIAWTRSPSP
jgi:hypothetical protein